ncbi:DUF2490 domain-containing protein [Runella sp.]|uniref:DUF2490 domain-containing protein n=1 Tax=Runella sp. TaxID=1960881 RepID=UPI003D11553A
MSKIRSVAVVLPFFLLLLHGHFVIAQNRTDFQAWPGASLKLDLPKKWAVTIQYRSRFIENSTYYKGSYLFGAVEYDFHKNLEVMANYRLAMVDVGVFHRYFVGVAGKAKFGRFNLMLRPAIQYQSQRFTGDDEVRLDADTYFRPRFTVKYKLSKKWDVYAYAEPFMALNGRKTKIDNWQNSIGFKYEFLKNQKLNPYFIWQPDYSHKKYMLTNYIVGLDIEFSVKPFKKSKKNKKQART